MIDKTNGTLIKGTNNSVIPEGVVTIYQYSFSKLSSLKEVIIPDTVKVIRSSAFSSCPALEKVIISASVPEIDVDAFDYGDQLKDVFFEATEKQLGYHRTFGETTFKVYYAREWEYVDGVPTPAS